MFLSVNEPLRLEVKRFYKSFLAKMGTVSPKDLGLVIDGCRKIYFS